MAFLVEEKNSRGNKRNIKRVDIELLAIGKHIGLSFAEINELRVCDLLALADSYTGANEKGANEKEVIREATQADIDRLLT